MKEDARGPVKVGQRDCFFRVLFSPFLLLFPASLSLSKLIKISDRSQDFGAGVNA